MLTGLVAIVVSIWRFTTDRTKLEAAIAEQLGNAGGDVYRDRDGRVSEIYVFDISESDPATWKSLARLTRIVSFDDDCTDADLKAIAKCGSVQELVMNGGSYSGEGLAALEGLPELRLLSLRDSYLSSLQVNGLACNTRLKSLDIGLKESAIPEFEAKSFLSNLEVLDVRLEADVSSGFAVPPPTRLRKLDRLNIRGGSPTGELLSNLVDVS